MNHVVLNANFPLTSTNAPYAELKGFSEEHDAKFEDTGYTFQSQGAYNDINYDDVLLYDTRSLYAYFLELINETGDSVNYRIDVAYVNFDKIEDIPLDAWREDIPDTVLADGLKAEKEVVRLSPKITAIRVSLHAPAAPFIIKGVFSRV